MLEFDIKFIEEKHTDEFTRYGSIKIKGFQEKFEIDISFWKPDSYIRHWEDAISRTVSGKPKSCLITSLPNPRHANFLFWWPMYRTGNDIFVQNGVLFLSTLETNFDPFNPYIEIPEREVFSEEGEPISEWTIRLHELQAWLDRHV